MSDAWDFGPGNIEDSGSWMNDLFGGDWNYDANAFGGIDYFAGVAGYDSMIPAFNIPVNNAIGGSMYSLGQSITPMAGGTAPSFYDPAGMELANTYGMAAPDVVAGSDSTVPLANDYDPKRADAMWKELQTKHGAEGGGKKEGLFDKITGSMKENPVLWNLGFGLLSGIGSTLLNSDTKKAQTKQANASAAASESASRLYDARVTTEANEDQRKDQKQQWGNSVPNMAMPTARTGVKVATGTPTGAMAAARKKYGYAGLIGSA